MLLFLVTEKKIACSIADVLIFFSGASCEPPLGFPNHPKVFFLDDEDRFCTASTCDILLRLPVVYNEYEHFKEAAILSFKGNDGFGGGV